MSGGFTPFDKNSYRESKRRRKQALIEERTGRILPVSNPRQRYIALACVGVILVAAIAFGIFSILKTDLFKISLSGVRKKMYETRGNIYRRSL